MESIEHTTPIRTSLVVPSVQELVSTNKHRTLTVVPSRYVQSEHSNTAVLPSDDLHIPVIDMKSLLAGDSSQLQTLHSACMEWGFFQVVNHGASHSLLEKFKIEVKEFFELPKEEKTKFWQTADEPEGFGQAFVISEEQKLDWGDAFTITTLPHALRKPHLFPNLPSQLRDAMEGYTIEVQALALKIVEYMGEALGKDTQTYFQKLFRDMNQTLRINYYSPCPEPDKVIGLSSHSDGNAITLLLQLNEMEGLQIKKDNNWLWVNPLPNAFIVNIGDILEIVTNGVYRSIEHRVVVNRNKERLSVAAFHNPGLDEEIRPSSSLITHENPVQFHSTTTLEYLKGYFARKLQGKRYLGVVRVQDDLDQL